jgi:hypothetical protein
MARLLVTSCGLEMDLDYNVGAGNPNTRDNVGTVQCSLKALGEPGLTSPQGGGEIPYRNGCGCFLQREDSHV